MNLTGDAGICYYPCTTSRTSISVLGTHFDRTDSLPWPGETYLIYLVGKDAIFGASHNGTDLGIEGCRWKVVFNKCTAFFSLYNEKTKFYIRLLDGSMYIPTLGDRSASAFLPLRHRSGGYQPIWFHDIFLRDDFGAHAEVQPIQGSRWEFVRV